ncbi:Transmembrane protein 211 [Liparis tanakae]|uniref:Transmembrane protein 211 n=1 Tax=Liparis tanakae TaxID=230148 RepID=A0A4Z2IYB0_9TELE|nr:Transmembrane protein 211 [Liparis tanakae]
MDVFAVKANVTSNKSVSGHGLMRVLIHLPFEVDSRMDSNRQRLCTIQMLCILLSIRLASFRVRLSRLHSPRLLLTVNPEAPSVQLEHHRGAACLLALRSKHNPNHRFDTRTGVAEQRSHEHLFIMAAGLLVYPFGLNSSLVRSFCGASDIYYAGECQIGWGYMLAIVGVMLTVFLPFFAKYAPKEQLSPTPLPTLL